MIDDILCIGEYFLLGSEPEYSDVIILMTLLWQGLMPLADAGAIKMFEMLRF